MYSSFLGLGYLGIKYDVVSNNLETYHLLTINMRKI